MVHMRNTEIPLNQRLKCFNVTCTRAAHTKKNCKTASSVTTQCHVIPCEGSLILLHLQVVLVVCIIHGNQIALYGLDEQLYKHYFQHSNIIFSEDIGLFLFCFIFSSSSVTIQSSIHQGKFFDFYAKTVVPTPKLLTPRAKFLVYLSELAQ